MRKILCRNRSRGFFRKETCHQAVRQRYAERYLLHVGRIMPRMNLERLVQGFDLLAPRFENLHLVLTGGTGFGSTEVLQQIEA